MQTPPPRFDIYPGPDGLYPLSATDIAHYHTVDRCARALRLRMFAQTAGESALSGQFRRAQVQLVLPPPYPLALGRAYEQHINTLLTAAHPHLVADANDSPNQLLVEAAQRLQPGARMLVLQPTVSAEVGSWRLSGRPDVVLLQCSDDGTLVVSIADIKSARAASAAHFLQVAVYARICAAVFAAGTTIRTAILYQPPLVPPVDAPAAARAAEDAARAVAWYAIDAAWCALPDDPTLWQRELARIFASHPHAAAASARTLPYDDLPIAFTAACSACPYQHWCLQQAAVHDDLALIPTLDHESRSAYRAVGVHTCAQLASLATVTSNRRLVLDDTDPRVASLVAHPTVGPQLETHIARAYRRSATQRDQVPYLPTSMTPSLPRISAEANPSLTLLWVDIHSDTTTGLVCALSSRILPHRDGQPLPATTHCTFLSAPPTLTDECALVQQAVAVWQRCAAPAATDLHVVVYDDHALQTLRALLLRHAASDPVVADWSNRLLQPRPHDAPLCTRVHTRLHESNFLDQPVVSLAQVGLTHWRSASPDVRARFPHELFDSTHSVPGSRTAQWIRVRPEASVPSAYLAAAWGTLPPPTTPDSYAGYRGVTRADIEHLLAQRMHVLVALTDQTAGRRASGRATAQLPSSTSDAFVTALAAVLQLERAAILAAWSSERAPHPAARVRAGDALIVSYADADQPAGVAARIAELRDLPSVPTRQHTALTYVCRLVASPDLPDIATQLALTDSLHVGTALLMAPLHATDNAPLPPDVLARTAMRVVVTAVDRTVDAATVTLQPVQSRNAPPHTQRGDAYVPVDGASYTLDPSPDDPPGLYTAQAVSRVAAAPSANRLAVLLHAPVSTPTARHPGLADYLDRVEAAGVAQFDAPGQQYLTAHGATPLLLVQGPPGTGKTFTTAHVVLARILVAQQQRRPLRIAVCAQTHAAVDAILGAVSDVIGTLTAPEFAPLRQLRLVRYRPNPHTPPLAQVTTMHDKASTLTSLDRHDWVVVGATPTPLGNLTHANQPWCDLLVLDESSQLSLPLALAAATPLHADGQIIVVGDPRQMPAIVSHDWEHEQHPLFRRYPVYLSLYDYVAAMVVGVPRVQLAESRRVPQQVAAFLNDAIYRHDGIDYHSHQQTRIPLIRTLDPLLHAVFDPAATMVLIRHDEAASHTKNPFEVALVLHLLRALIAAGYDGATGYGVVVPHRMQRAAISTALAAHTAAPDPHTTHWPGIDTVERFQGSQRQIMFVSATESHPSTIARNERFLYDARRLNVALSRAQRKVVLIAAHTVFAHTPSDPLLRQQPAIWQQYAQWCNQHVADLAFQGVALTITQQQHL